MRKSPPPASECPFHSAIHPNVCLAAPSVGIPRRGVFKSVPDLIAAIGSYVEQRNRNPTPFVWMASVQSILNKIERANEALEALH